MVLNFNWKLRVGKGSDFVMIDLLSPDNKTTTFHEPLGAITLTKKQYNELVKFCKENPDFAKSLK